MRRLIKTSKISTIYAGENIPHSDKSIFLAGPTPRSQDVKSWRDDALKILEKLNFDGIIIIPEARSGEKYPDYENQIDWESEGLNTCHCILFWIPRDLEKLPGFTTNCEWGEWYKDDKVVLGFPKDSPKNNYLKYKWEKLGKKLNYTLEDTIMSAIKLIQ